MPLDSSASHKSHPTSCLGLRTGTAERVHEPRGQHSKNGAETSAFHRKDHLSPKWLFTSSLIPPLHRAAKRAVCSVKLSWRVSSHGMGFVASDPLGCHPSSTFLHSQIFVCIFWLLPSPILFSLTLWVYVSLVLYCHFSGFQKGKWNKKHMSIFYLKLLSLLSNSGNTGMSKSFKLH